MSNLIYFCIALNNFPYFCLLILKQRMKRIIFLTLLISILVSLKAQHNWSIDSDEFLYSQSINGQAYVQGNIVNGQGIQLGAFCGDECRGIAKTTGGSCTFSTFPLVVYGSQEQGEIIHFVLRDTEFNEYEIFNTIVFEDGVQIGNLENPFLWMDEFLYSSADFLYFAAIIGEDGIINTSLKTITLFIDQNQPLLSEIAPYFVAAPGAKVFVNDQEQFSEISTVNLNQPVVYSVKGVDGLVTDWTVNAEILSSIEIREHVNAFYPTISYDGYFNVNLDKNLVFEVLDVFGRVVIKTNSTLTNSTFFVQKKGSYFIKLTYPDGQIKVEKIQRL